MCVRVCVCVCARARARACVSALHRLEEEAKTLKKHEAELRQRKAREERPRKEVEKKQQLLLDKEVRSICSTCTKISNFRY